ncbi:MAG: helix-turn-helix domain-containing protein [Polaromonas sp.]|nr:helix-turn-helix domain-containing protein [Polaromonas sp.]
MGSFRRTGRACNYSPLVREATSWGSVDERLGYRNFPSYINEYRLQEMAARLLEPSLDRRSILTLALEAGVGSIGPFNRTFRNAHGMTSSEFRSWRVAPAVADAGENRT